MSFQDLDKPVIDISLIKDITLPTSVELKAMDKEELKAWLDKLAPFYEWRSEILREFGVDEWQKVMNWPFIFKIYEKKQNEQS